MIRATINGEQRSLEEGTTLAQLVDELCVSAKGIAVAVDREVVPRSAWREHRLVDGARVEVVTAAAGG